MLIDRDLFIAVIKLHLQYLPCQMMKGCRLEKAACYTAPPKSKKTIVINQLSAELHICVM